MKVTFEHGTDVKTRLLCFAKTNAKAIVGLAGALVALYAPTFPSEQLQGLEALAIAFAVFMIPNSTCP